MSTIGKGITAVLGILAVLACLLTVGIIGYAIVGNGNEGDTPEVSNELPVGDVTVETTDVPSVIPESDGNTDIEPTQAEYHVHNYVENVLKQPTCTEAGLTEYKCSCGDSYTVDILSKGHVPDEWEVSKKVTETEDGYKVRKCIYCDMVLAKEVILSEGSGKQKLNPDGTVHEHLYVSTVEREPSCTLAGLRMHTCECGNFYTDSIPAVGHVASDWSEKEAATQTSTGTSARTCAVCGATLDIKSIPALTPSPNASASASASSSAGASASPGASASASASPSASPTPHTHNYTSYVVTPATCTEKGVRSFVCSCGSSYAESIELDLNNHKFEATFVSPTESQQGYTVYTCVRCNYNYKDNYLLPLKGGSIN